MVEEDKKPKEKAVFNSAAAYCESLITIERAISDKLLAQDYVAANEYIDILYMELCEWFEDDIKEKEIQDKARKDAYAAANEISAAIKNGKKFIDIKNIEALKQRYILLKCVIHKWGLRMPQTEDISGIPSLMRPARMGFRR